MPDALIIYRHVWTAHDPNPRSEGWPSGADWFNRFWPIYSQIKGVDYFQFENEWAPGNKETSDPIIRFNRYFEQLIDACVAHGVKCTIGNWGQGGIGYPTIPEESRYLPLIQGMLTKAERTGMLVNYHCYAPEGTGATDMAAGQESYVMRWEILCKGHPNLKVYGGEGSNAGKDLTGRQGVFRGDETLRLQAQAAKMVAESPFSAQFAAICWWQVCDGPAHTNPEADWSKDDWSSVLPAFFDWSASYSG